MKRKKKYHNFSWSVLSMFKIEANAMPQHHFLQLDEPFHSHCIVTVMLQKQMIMMMIITFYSSNK